VKYSLDSDAIINAWRDYPIQNFPKVLDWVEQLGKGGVGGMSEVVFRELARGGDECYDWFSHRKKIFVHPNTEKVQEEVGRLVNLYKNFGLITGKNEGDPYVVALAKVNAAVVVTNESPSNNMNGPKIPDVCRVEEIKVIKFVQMLKEAGGTFG
jgi:hypothetical protein